MLAGERTRTFMSPKEGPKLVCDLCRERAGRLGWVDPAAAGANVGRRPAPEVAESPASRLERAREPLQRTAMPRAPSPA